MFVLLTSDFRSDTVPTVLLAVWPLEATMWDGEALKGPFPSLFSEDPKKTEDGLRSNPDRAHADMNKIARCFFIPEHISLAAAVAMVKKPR